MSFLNKKISFYKKEKIKEVFEKAEIRKKDMENPTIIDNLIADNQKFGKINLLEADNILKKYNVSNTISALSSRLILAYDESIQKFSKLQGTLAITSHCIIAADINDYDYTCYLTAYFLTNAKKYEKTELALVGDEVDDPEMKFKKKYLEDRYEFLMRTIPEKSIIFIDGPLIGGQQSQYNIKLVKGLLSKDIIPIFYVKNSFSRLLVENLQGSLKNEYNSDLHYMNNFLKYGERSSYIRYIDQDNKENNKVFGYIKCYENVPQRFEFSVETYEKYNKLIDSILDSIFYYSTLQGTPDNPEIRPIAIAEIYAREALKFVYPIKFIDVLNLDDTMNARRGFTR